MAFDHFGRRQDLRATANGGDRLVGADELTQPFPSPTRESKAQLDAATQVNSYSAHTTDRGSVLLSRPGGLVRTPVDRCEYVLLNVL